MKKLSIKQQLEQLEQTAAQFQSGDLEIEEALTKYEEAVAIALQLKKKLKDVNQKIQTISQKYESQD